MIWGLVAIVGFLAVYQAGMNRLIGAEWGMPGAVLLNAFVFLAAAASFFAGVQWGVIPSHPIWQNIAPFQSFRPWFLIPGIFGFIFVMGVPIAISKLGANMTFVGLIVTQIAAGITWDYLFEQRGVSLNKWLGLTLAFIGIWLATRTAEVHS